MEFAALIQVIILLAVVGFGVWLVEQAPISDIFKKAIQFVSILAVLLYVLKTFGVI